MARSIPAHANDTLLHLGNITIDDNVRILAHASIASLLHLHRHINEAVCLPG